MARPARLGDGPSPGGTPSLLRSMNARTILELIDASGPISRAQIARDSGLSKPTVSLVLSQLVASGVVCEVGRVSAGRGPAAVLYRIDPTIGHVVGIDIGKGWIRAELADLSGTAVARRDRRSTARSSRALLDRLGEVVAEVLDDAGLTREQVTRWVVGTPGVVKGAGLTLAHSLPGWQRPETLERLHALTGDVVVENDVNLAAIAEQRFGHGAGVDDFVVVSIGTGVGVGLVLGGTLYRGATGAAGEVGYLPLGAPTGRSGRRAGPLDDAVGADAVVRDARSSGLTGRLTAASVFDSARAGDPVARRVVEAEADRVGQLVAAVVSVVDPSLVVLGGGIGKNADLLLKGVRARLHAISPLRPPVEVSELGDDAVLRGALAVALDLARNEVFGRATNPVAPPAVALA